MKTLSQIQTQQRKLVGEQKLGERGRAGSATETGQEPIPQLRTESQQKELLEKPMHVRSLGR